MSLICRQYVVKFVSDRLGKVLLSFLLDGHQTSNQNYNQYTKFQSHKNLMDYVDAEWIESLEEKIPIFSIEE